MGETRARLHALDALRGLAALSVILWHWQHFQLLGTSRLTWTVSAEPLSHVSEPFFAVLRPFYTQGYFGVEFFFLISGFIFFRLYGDNIASGSLSVTEFAWRRLSRLYPLHLVTLLLIALLQFAFHRRTGQYFIYGAGGVVIFLKSLILFQVNGDGAAFNGPEWSVTIEIIMYGIFFALARIGLLRGMLVPLAMFAVGLVLYSKHQNIALGLCGFFEGGLVYLIVVQIRQSAFRKPIIGVTAACCLCAWAIALAATYAPGSRWISALAAVAQSHPLLSTLCTTDVLFPTTMLLVCLHEDIGGADYRGLSWLGEISYSSYLLHFPLQLLFALAITRGLLPIGARNSDIFMLIYFGILVIASLLVYRKFELPMQHLLRRAWADNAGAAKMQGGTTSDIARLRATPSSPAWRH